MMGNCSAPCSWFASPPTAGRMRSSCRSSSAERLMHGSSTFARYQQPNAADANPTDMLRRYELSDQDVDAVVAEIRRLNLMPLATPFSTEDVERIDKLDLPAIKIASPDLVNWPLLRRAARTDRPLLISTGAASINEITSAVAWLRGWKANVRPPALHQRLSDASGRCEPVLDRRDGSAVWRGGGILGSHDGADERRSGRRRRRRLGGKTSHLELRRRRAGPCYQRRSG